ncbi:Plasmid partition protein A [Klebsiella pneumoniae]|nr:Plasmid partition protein A [Klebsiella pneumoniae]
MDNIEQLRKVATRAGKLLTSLSESIRQQKEELKLTEFYQEYSKAALYKLPKLSKGSVEYVLKWKPVATFLKRNLLVIR